MVNHCIADDIVSYLTMKLNHALVTRILIKQGRESTFPGSIEIKCSRAISRYI